jgi:hypothetical protein
MDTDKAAPQAPQPAGQPLKPPQERLGAEIVAVRRATSRRGFFKVAATAAVVIGGSVALDEVLHKPPKPHDPVPKPPTATPGPVVSGSFVSAKRGNVATGYAIGYPPGNHRNPLPVLVALHANAASHTSAFTDLHLQDYLAAAVAAGVPPFAIASVDGGAGTFWHKRTNTDPAGMVIDEFLPLLANVGLDTRRVGFFGWSSGGYGALYLASLLGSARVACVGAESPAVWQHYQQAPSGAFDSASDFAANTIFARLRDLSGIPLRIDVATKDPYLAGGTALRAALHPTPEGGIEPGYGDLGFWVKNVPAQLAFAGSHLAGAAAGKA